MTQQQRAPEPKGNDWQAWGRRLMIFLGQTRSALVQQTGEETAAEDGIIMWDRTEAYPVVSKSNEFRQIILEGGHAKFMRTTSQTAASADTAYSITYDAPTGAQAGQAYPSSGGIKTTETLATPLDIMNPYLALNYIIYTGT